MNCVEHNQRGRSGGYGGTTWNGRHIGLHVKAYCVAHGLTEAPTGMVVRHKCDNPRCINPAHLELGTHADNMNDRNVRGRTANGFSHGRVTLDEPTLVKVKELLGIGASQREVAKRFGISQRTVGRISRGEYWKNVA